MPLLLVLAVVIGFLLFGNTHHADPVYPPGVTNCEVGITPEAADKLTELQLFNARAWVMRECNGVPIHDITQETLDCEDRIAAEYPADQWSREMYDRQLKCPGEPVVDDPQHQWHQR